MYLKLAWRNIWRNKRRSLITIASIFFAVFFAVGMRSLQLGSYDKMIDNIVRFYTGYVQVHGKGYFEEQSLENSIEYDQKLIKNLQELPHVTLAAERLQGFALSSAGLLTKGVMV